MTKYCVILAIMDMASANSDVFGQKKKYVFGVFLLYKKVTKTKKIVSKCINPNCIEFNLSFNEGVVYIQIIKWSRAWCVIIEAHDVLRNLWIL